MTNQNGCGSESNCSKQMDFPSIKKWQHSEDSNLTTFEQIELPAKLLDDFLCGNKSNVYQLIKVGRQEEIRMRRAEDSDVGQDTRGHWVAQRLVPVTDFIFDENQKCCGNKIGQPITLISKTVNGAKRLRWGGKEAPWHRPVIFSNPNDKKGRRKMQLELVSALNTICC